MSALTLTPRTPGTLGATYIGLETSGHLLLETTGGLLTEAAAAALVPRTPASFDVLLCSILLLCSDTLACSQDGLGARGLGVLTLTPRS